MEEEGDRSSASLRPQGSVVFADGSITAEWASLQPDLVQLIADCVLSTNGVDEYMAMRAVCHCWRSAVAKPSPRAAVADLRFRPRQWVVLHGAVDDQGRPLFLNVTTGRFRRLRRPLLREYILVGASDGLLVLGDRERPHAARLLNPLTGDMLPFAAPVPPEPRVGTAIAGSQPTIIFSFDPVYGKYQDIPAYCSVWSGSAAVYSADPIGQLRVVKVHAAALNEEDLFRRMVSYAGNVYVLSVGGTLRKIVWTGGHWYAERIMEMHKHYYNGYLAEFAGKLLLVRQESKTIELLSVDVNRKVLEPIESIGSCALFLSSGKCMVVNADKLPTIMRNSIYKDFNGKPHFCYDLSDGKKTYIPNRQLSGDGPRAESGIIHEGPLSLAQVLLTPCPEVKAQLDRIQQI